MLGPPPLPPVAPDLRPLPDGSPTPSAMPTLPAPGTSALGPPAGVVLVAADDADMRLYLRVCLRVMGLGIVLEATGGGEALRLARAVAPALVICDLVMPGLGGEGLCRALKADRYEDVKGWGT